MRIVHDKSIGAHNVDVFCLACGKRMRLCDASIDLDGPAFAAYYHAGCVPPTHDKGGEG